MTAERRGVLAVAGAALLWSTGGLGIKAVDAPALTVAAYRSAVAAALLLLVLRPTLRGRGAAMLVALACYAGCVVTFVVATKWTTAANAIFLQYSSVVWVLLLSPRLLGEPLRPRDVAAVAAALAGLALVFAGRLEASRVAGDVVALVSGAFQAGLILALRHGHGRGRGADAAVAWGNVAVLVLLLPVVARDPWVAPRSLAILAFLGAVQLGAAYLLFLRGIALVPATEAALVAMLEPVANPLWVFLVLGERPSAQAVVGGAIVLGAIAWRTARSEAAAPAG